MKFIQRLLSIFIAWICLLSVHVDGFCQLDATLVSKASARTYSPTQLQGSFGGDDRKNDDSKPWLTTGLLVSSFSDGIKPNPEAQDFLMRGLIKSMLTDKQRKAEISVQDSVVQSPCCGPDISAINSLEKVDNALASLDQSKSSTTSWSNLVESLLSGDGENEELELRFLYIPTAMYALRADSTRSPGKQRQRARADGKKRRNDIVEMIKDRLGAKVSVLAATLDFDDGSIKQPEGSDDKKRFPTVSCILSFMPEQFNICRTSPLTGLVNYVLLRMERMQLRAGSLILFMYKAGIHSGYTIA